MRSDLRWLVLALLLGWQSAEASEPDTVLAEVDGQPIRASAIIAPETERNRERMSPEEFAEWREYSLNKRTVMAIRDSVLGGFAKREGLEPTDAEIDRFIEHQNAGLKNLPWGGPDRTHGPGFRRAQEWMGKRIVREVKVGQALWREHGGTCGFGKLGSCTPFEAEHTLYRAEVEAGRLVFKDQALADRFWRAITDKRQLADVVHDEPAEIERIFETLSAGWRESANP